MGKLSRKKKVRWAEQSEFAAAAADNPSNTQPRVTNKALAFLAGLLFCAAGCWMIGKTVSYLAQCLWLQRLPTTAIQMENLEVGWRVLERGQAVPDFKAKFSFKTDGQTIVGTNFYPATLAIENYSFEECFAQRDKLSRVETADCRFDLQQPSSAFLLVPWNFGIDGLTWAFLGVIFSCLGLVAILAGRGHDQSSRALRICAFGAFGGIALFFIFLLLIVPGWNYVRASSWQSVPATVVHSGRKQTSRGRSTAEVVYEYRIEGRTYLNNRLGFLGGKSAAKGASVTCWVNPDKPWQSVLDRKLRWISLAAILPVAILFVLVRVLRRKSH